MAALVREELTTDRASTAACADGVYDLAGRCVLRGASETALHQLPRGIYVVCKNGVRRVVKK